MKKIPRGKEGPYLFSFVLLWMLTVGFVTAIALITMTSIKVIIGTTLLSMVLGVFLAGFIALQIYGEEESR